jgi:hypothetical protein
MDKVMLHAHRSVIKPAVIRPLGRQWHRRKNYIKICVKIECAGVQRFKLAQETDQWWALINIVMNLSVS